MGLGFEDFRQYNLSGYAVELEKHRSSSGQYRRWLVWHVQHNVLDQKLRRPPNKNGYETSKVAVSP